MAFNTNPPDAAEIKEWFLDNPSVAPNTFELALVLGGTVSAGAYTAGALDFLIEALDEWTARQVAGDAAAPKHKVVLRVITGTSGGGVNAAIAARVLNYDFPPISRGTPIGAGSTGNPFYDAWIKTLTLDRFLDPSDIGDDLVSLLNGAAIDEGTQNIIAFSPAGERPRPWVGAPLRLILTLTNLRGVPYRLDFGNGHSESYVDHADFIRFAVCYPGQTIGRLRPDELTLAFDGTRLPQATSWDDFAEFACATAAFPVGFPPRALVRPTNHYRYRVTLRAPTDPAAAALNALPYAVSTPDWDALRAAAADVPEDYHMLAVDGGATNNEPIELGRTALCGIRASNPRDPRTANRAVLLIDPFAGKAGLGPERRGSFAAVLGHIASAIIQQTRYDSRDLTLAADPDVFSRFMLTPQRGQAVGDKAIASAGLGAFIGFACPDFMRYDYLLGRYNCREYLRKEFVLADSNPVFKDCWTAQQKSALARDAGPGFLPLVPLMGNAAVDETLDPWPKGKLDPESYRNRIEARFRAIFENEVSGTLFRSALGWIGAHATQAQAADFIIGLMKKSLVEAGLA